MNIEPDIRKSNEWRYAEDLFKRIYANRPGFSIIGISPTPGPSWAAIDFLMERILTGCPQFFPALFQRGEYLLRIGKTTEGEEFIEKAFNVSFNIITDEEEFNKVITQRTENLGELLRYDLAAKYMEKATHLFPDNASFYDYLAYYLLQLPETDKNRVLEIQQNALEIEPDNDFFINNMGWIYLMQGNYEEAGEYFRKAINFSSESTAIDNLEIANYMKEHGMAYFQYLLRPADISHLDDLQSCAEFDEAANICKIYNSDKIEAFKIRHLQKKTFPPHEILSTLYPLKEFLNTIYESIASGEGIFVFENIDHFFKKSDLFISQFIDDNETESQPLPGTTLSSLTVFYDFLQETTLITPDQYTQIIDHINLLQSVTRIPPPADASWEEIERRLEELIEEPRYYPVLFKWGEYMLGKGINSYGEKFIEKAFNAAITIFTKEGKNYGENYEENYEENYYEEEDDGEKTLQDIFIQKSKVLGMLLRYDLAAKYMEEAIRIFPGEAIFYDHLASYLLRIPATDERQVIEIQQKALQIEPYNDSFINNLGRIYLMMGNYERAMEYFRQAADVNNENTNAVENLEIADYMKSHKLTYLQFLLNVTPGEIPSFSDIEVFNNDLVFYEEYNANKLKAFEIYHLQKKSLAPHEILNIIKPIELLLDIIYESLENESNFYFENIELFIEKARDFIFQFIDRYELEGEQALHEIIRSLTVFYNFLWEGEVISQDQNSKVVEQLDLIKTEFSGILDKYYQICDDFTISVDEKEEKVKELFGI